MRILTVRTVLADNGKMTDIGLSLFLVGVKNEVANEQIK